MSNRLLIGLLVAIVLLSFVQGAYAFGAGNIPSFSFLEGRAFRHGDIEDILAEIAKKGGGGSALIGKLLGSGKFGGLDIKRIYFGNWLRDYSQAMDVAGLSKLSRQQILNLVMALGFLAHGYATQEFEVTEDRLGVYLPTEHIDNPKGYNDGKDARQVHPGLRPPVQQIELEIDPRTGMKNYIANESGGSYDTSAGLVRRVMRRCIDMGRQARSSGNDNDLWEAYRLLGTFLHTLEDLPAHSNWCELALVKLGYRDCRVQSPAGPVPPLVTGTFGGSDFMHSLLGEATDHVSEASVTDLNKKLAAARSAPGDASADHLADLMMGVPGGGGQDMQRDLQGIRAIGQPGSKDASQMTPQELYATCWQVLSFRDRIVKNIEQTIEKIPGLGPLIERLTEALNRFVFTTLEPYLKPIMQAATGTLQSGSAAVINTQDQYEVFNSPYASDPTHSLLSKDHFDLILNESAGELARIIVRHTVELVVRAWDTSSINADEVINDVLGCFHHPMFADGRSKIQQEMMQFMQQWISNHQDRDYVLRSLTKQSVRAGTNKRKGHGTQQSQSILPGPQQLFNSVTSGIQGQMHGAAQHIPGYQQYNSMMGQGGGRRDIDPSEMPSNQQPYVPQPQSSFPSHDQQQYSQHQGYGGGHSFPQPQHHGYGGDAQYNPGYGGGGMPEPQGYQQPYGAGQPQYGQAQGYPGQHHQQSFPDAGGYQGGNRY